MTALEGSPAEKYGRMLRRAIRERRLLSKTVAAAIDADPQTVSEWIRGRKLPTFENMEALAEVTGYEPLRLYGKRLRTKTCKLDGCDRSYIDTSRRFRKQFCSKQHTDTYWKRHRYGRAASVRRLEKQELEIFRETMHRWCSGCEPTGVCYTADCEWRPVSPFTLVRRKDVDGAVPQASERMVTYLRRRYDGAA